MNMRQIGHHRSSSNGYDHRKVERDTGISSDNKFQTAKGNSSRSTFGKGGGVESLSHDRLIYLTTCLIGHQVEIQVLDGTVFSGIFHTINAGDFGIVLKMAQLIEDGSRGPKNISDFPSKPPARTLIIPAKDLVQVKAKGVPVTKYGLTSELQHEKQQELMTDSYISQSWHVEVGRELERWVPDEDDPGCPELENTFDGAWNRGWDQFEVNATLFGVKSTFDEELYTTKLQRGPQMRELEEKATQLAREIESEETPDLHLAEERGIDLDGNLEIDEETRFSSVYRGVDDCGYHEIEDILLNSQNDETFGGVSSSVSGKPKMDISAVKTSDRTQVPSRSLSVGEEVQSSLTVVSKDVYHSGSEVHGRQLLTEQLPKQSSAIDTSRFHDNQFSGRAKGSCLKEGKEEQLVLHQNRALKAEDPSHAASKNMEKVRFSDQLSEGAIPSKAQGTTSVGQGLSSNSPIGSLSSEKSTLNPHAKEFKLNPKARSFMPSQTPLRPSSPVANSPFYYPANVASVTQMHGMPVGIGMGPSFTAQQPVIFNPQAVQMPQPYYHPIGPQYGQQLMMEQPRPVVYMPAYPAEMPHKGREF